jgi:hypothetical protein
MRFLDRPHYLLRRHVLQRQRPGTGAPAFEVDDVLKDDAVHGK